MSSLGCEVSYNIVMLGEDTSSREGDVAVRSDQGTQWFHHPPNHTESVDSRGFKLPLKVQLPAWKALS